MLHGIDYAFIDYAFLMAYLSTHLSQLKIKFVLVTAKALNVTRIKYENCTLSPNFTEKTNADKGGIGIVIADTHILPFTMKKPEDAMQLLHHDIDGMNVDAAGHAGRLREQNPKKNTKFSYSCAELFYERYHKAELKNGKLKESKVWTLT